MAIGNAFDNSKKLDCVAQLSREFNVHRRNVADALDVDFVRAHPETMRERGEDADFVLRIPAVNVEVRRRLGVAQLLRVGEHGVEIRAFELHPGKDVIAGAVDDAVKRVNAVADKTFTQRFDDGNAAANARLVIKIRAVFFGRGKQFLAVRGQQRLVGRDDRLAELERGQDHRPGNARAADEFGDDVHLRVVDDALPVGRHERTRNRVRSRLVEGLHGDLADVDLDADARGHEAAVELERVKHAAAHGAAANHAKVYLLHRNKKFAAKWSRGQFNFEPRNTRELTQLNRTLLPRIINLTSSERFGIKILKYG